MNRTEAKLQGLKIYQGRPHSCGSIDKYVSSMSCVACTTTRSRHNLDDVELMAPYRTKEKGRKKLNQWRAKNPDKVRSQWKRGRPRQRQYYRENSNAFRDRQLRKDYGITLTEYESMLRLQHMKCAICRKESCASGKNFAVDHNHKTGKVRGLLCMLCNNSLGGFRDNVRLLKRAIKYLENQ